MKAKCVGKEKVHLKDHQCYPTMNNIESTLRSSVTANNNNTDRITGAVSAGASASSSFASSPTDASSVCVDTTDAEQQVKPLYFSHASIFDKALEMHAPNANDDPPMWGEEMDLRGVADMFDDIDNLEHPIFDDPQDSQPVDVKPSASEETSPNNPIFDDSLFTLGDMPHVSQSHSQDNDVMDTSFNEQGIVFDNGPVFYDNVDGTTEGFSSSINDYTDTLLLQESISTTSIPPLMLRTLPESEDIPRASSYHQTRLLGQAKCDPLPMVTPPKRVTLTSDELKSEKVNEETLPQSKVSSLPLSMSQKSTSGLHQRLHGNSCINDNAVASTPRSQGKEHQAHLHDVRRRAAAGTLGSHVQGRDDLGRRRHRLRLLHARSGRLASTADKEARSSSKRRRRQGWQQQ